jgi:hypothetical protein
MLTLTLRARGRGRMLPELAVRGEAWMVLFEAV